MNALLWILVLAAALALAAHLASRQRVQQLRRAGIYPQAGQATMADVLRLAENGYRTWAVRCYREIHGGTLRQASAAVAKLAAGS